MDELRPLDGRTVEAILERLPRLTVGVLGDLFLDRYLDLDAALTEPSLETGLDAYQVVNVRPSPGAAGTVLNNLVALGVGRVCPIAVVGRDGEGYELRQALRRFPTADASGVLGVSGRRTPTYTKPILHEKGAAGRELNRLDIKNRGRTPRRVEGRICRLLSEVWPQLDALVVMDQVSETDCGVVTATVRERLAELAAADAGKFVLADSRERIGLFRHTCLKPNRAEALQAAGQADDGEEALPRAAETLARRAGRWVFCTDGPRGIVVSGPREGEDVICRRVAGYPVAGPIDIVGAGDSTSAGIACAVAAGAGPEAAAAFGNLVASITIQQLGTTGTATPAQVRQRWDEVSRGR